MKKKTVAVYARVSTDKQKVDMQLQELTAFIKRSGWKLYPRMRVAYLIIYIKYLRKANRIIKRGQSRQRLKYMETCQ